MCKLTETEAGRLWVNQFREGDRAAAVALLDAVTLVSRDELVDRLRSLLTNRAAVCEGPVALYAEREVRKWKGVPNRLFKETTRRPRRAYGAGPSPIRPAGGGRVDVGSEGIIAQLITEVCRSDPAKYHNHPGPDAIRKARVRTFVLLTDFIGSGLRARAYLDAAWRVASVKSWYSMKFIRFEVIAYSATDSGRRAVEGHPSSPVVNLVVPCPTIDSELPPAIARDAKRVCSTYDPVERNSPASLGFGGVGALLAFAHGCPNNAPRILFRKGRRWRPLFPGRVTFSTGAAFGGRRDDTEAAVRLARLGEARLARGRWLRRAHPAARAMLLVLAALRRCPARPDAISRRTGLTIPEVLVLLERATDHGWVGARHRLTDDGRSQLAHARAAREPHDRLASGRTDPYYPSSLRMP